IGDLDSPAFQQSPPYYGPTACSNHNALKVVIGVSADAIARRVVIRAGVLLTHNRGHLQCRADDTVNVSSTAWRSKLERLMTLSTSAVAVCCCSDSRRSVRRRVFSIV